MVTYKLMDIEFSLNATVLARADNRFRTPLVKAFFSNSSTDCRLEFSYLDGHRKHIVFDSSAELVDYCKKYKIDVPMSNIFTEE